MQLAVRRRFEVPRQIVYDKITPFHTHTLVEEFRRGEGPPLC